MIKKDLSRFYDIHGKTLPAKIRLFLRNQGFQGVMIYRFGHWLLHQNLLIKLFLKIPYVLLNHHLKSAWGIDIDSHAEIGGGFVIFHYGGIHVGGEAVIGENFTIGHDVTIGVSGKGAARGVPKIGNNVTASAGASLHGKIMIGNNVKIGANAVVNRNVPDFALVQVPQMQVVTFPNYYKNTSADSENTENKKQEYDTF